MQYHCGGGSTKKKAKEKANLWLSQKPKPKILMPAEVFSVLEVLGFEFKRKLKHTTYLYTHDCLTNSEIFMFSTIKISVHHSGKDKDNILEGSVNKLLEALKLYMERNDD
jgi:hypothetical protein